MKTIRVFLVTNNPAPFDSNGGKFQISEENDYPLYDAQDKKEVNNIKCLAQTWFIRHLKQYGLSQVGWSSELSFNANYAKFGGYEYHLACAFYDDMHVGMEIMCGDNAWMPQDSALRMDPEFSFFHQKYSAA